MHKCFIVLDFKEYESYKHDNRTYLVSNDKDVEVTVINVQCRLFYLNSKKFCFLKREKNRTVKTDERKQ